jgi:hypothetical protein
VDSIFRMISKTDIIPTGITTGMNTTIVLLIGKPLSGKKALSSLLAHDANAEIMQPYKLVQIALG